VRESTAPPWVPRLLMMCLVSVWVAPSSAETGAAVQKVQIANGIYQFITAPDGFVPNGNSVVIVNENDVLVFDTSTRPSTARTVIAEIRKITDKLVRYVVNSHHHPDHWSGRCVIPGHGPAWHDKDFLNLEAELLETVVSQVGQAVQRGMVTVEEIQKAVNVEPLRVKFTRDDKDLNRKFQRYVGRNGRECIARSPGRKQVRVLVGDTTARFGAFDLQSQPAPHNSARLPVIP
jgi:hypothetical protein